MYFVIVFYFCIYYIGLQNDHKSIMKLIEEKIHQLHEEARNKQNAQTSCVKFLGGQLRQRQDSIYISNICSYSYMHPL